MDWGEHSRASTGERSYLHYLRYSMYWNVCTAKEVIRMRKREDAQTREIQALKRMRDRDVDTSDIPPVDWSTAVVGKFYRPIKKPLTIRLDADVLAWFKGQGKGYQTRINALLRSSMDEATSPHSWRKAPRGSRRTARRAGT